MPTLNDPAVVTEIGALHDAYERALVAHDVAALAGFFWDSPLVVRYGVAEQLYGSEAIAAYRQSAAPVFTDRQLLRRSIVVFGPDTASVMCELSQIIGGQLRPSRQSQLWIRFPELGWKIASAHVSQALPVPASPWEAYIDRTAAAIGLPIGPGSRENVVRTFQRSAEIAAPLLAFPLPDSSELASVFTA